MKTITLLGDSQLAQNTADSASQLVYLDHGVITWLNVKSGNNFQIVKNAGLAGDTVRNMLTVRYDRDASMYNSDLLLIMGGINDLVSYGASADDVYNDLVALVEKARAKYPNQHVFVSGPPPLGSGHASQSAAMEDKIAKIARKLREYCSMQRLVDYVPFYEAIVDPTSNPSAALSGAVHTDNLHLTPTGCELIARAWWEKLQYQYVPDTDHVCSTADYIGTYSSSRQLIANPLFQGSGGNLFGVGSGTVAANTTVTWTTLDCVDKVCSVVARNVADDGDAIGNNQKIVVTTNANNQTLRVQSSAYGANLSPGDAYFMEMFVRIENATAVKSAQLWTFFNMSSPSYTRNIGGMFAGGRAFPSTLSWKGFVRTPTMIIPSTGTIGTCQLTLDVAFSGAGGADVYCGRAQVVKNPTNV